MRTITIICFLATMGATFARPNGSHYTDRYDNLDLNQILSNRRLLVPYLKCILDEGKCSPDGKELKAHIKEALETHCAKCTETQRKGTHQVIEHLINNEHTYWNQLVAKYDPTHKFTAIYEKDLKRAKH